MTTFENEVKNTLDYYDMMINSYENKLAQIPDGNLTYQKVGDRIQFFHTVNKNGSRVRKGINKNEDMQRALARKEFANRALRILYKNRSILKKILEGYSKLDPDIIINTMPKAYRMIPEKYFFDDITLTLQSADKRISRNCEWGSREYFESMYHAEKKNKRTSIGTYVRSKSELLIYESLLNKGIPMHYDEEHTINGIFIVPDFTFIDVKGELFFWEYFGMMDDPSYAKRNLKKLNDYYDANIIPGENLIVTFDKSDSINMGMIEAIINNEIITRL